jgi:hypothetical protein
MEEHHSTKGVVMNALEANYSPSLYELAADQQAAL